MCLLKAQHFHVPFEIQEFVQQQRSYLLEEMLLKDKAGYWNPPTKRQGLPAPKDQPKAEQHLSKHHLPFINWDAEVGSWQLPSSAVFR